MRLIDADKLSADMYHEAFEKDSDMQKWDSGCWIRYKMFENVLKAQPTVEAPDINVGNIDTTTHDSIPAKTSKNDGDKTSGDCISRTQAIDALVGVTMFKTKHEIMQRVNASVQDEQGWLGAVAECLDEIEDLPSAQPFHIITMTDVMKYIDDMSEDEWQEFTACLECRGWRLQWCGGDFA